MPSAEISSSPNRVALRDAQPRRRTLLGIFPSTKGIFFNRIEFSPKASMQRRDPDERAGLAEKARGGFGFGSDSLLGSKGIESKRN